MMTMPDITLSKGTAFRREFAVSLEVYEGFVRIFNDRNPYHVDDETAQRKGFARRIMHGNILGGFLSYFVGECLPSKEVVILSQEIKFHKPVYLNDTVTLEAEVAEIFESVRMAEIKFEFVNQDKVKVAKGKIAVGFL